MFLLNESNFRERFPGCTAELRRQAKQGNGNQEQASAAVTQNGSASQNGRSNAPAAPTTNGNDDHQPKQLGSTGFATAAANTMTSLEDENESEREAREIREVETVTGILDIKNVGLMGFWKVKDLLGEVIKISDVSCTATFLLSLDKIAARSSRRRSCMREREARRMSDIGCLCAIEE